MYKNSQLWSRLDWKYNTKTFPKDIFGPKFLHDFPIIFSL